MSTCQDAIVGTSRWSGRPKRLTWQSSTTSRRRGNRGEADHLVPTQRLEERLKAATNQAAHSAVDDLHVADPDGRCDLPRWRAGDECHLDSSAQELICHGSQVAPGSLPAESSGLRIGCVVAAGTVICNMARPRHRLGNLPAETT